MPEITVRVAAHGYTKGVNAVVIEGNGFQGLACREPLQRLVAVLGGDTQEEDKPDAYIEQRDLNTH